MRILSTVWKELCLYLLFFSFPLQEAEKKKKITKENVYAAYADSVQQKKLEFTNILLRLFLH